MMNMPEKVSQIPISRFSLMTRLTQKALRLYDKKKLLIPEAKDQITGYRYYSIRQIEKGIKIKILTSLGFGINQVAVILNAAENYSDRNKNILENVFSKRLSEIRREIHRLKKIEGIIMENKPIDMIYMNCSEPVIKEIPKVRVISKREQGTYSVTISKLIQELMRQIFSPDNQRNNVKITSPIMFICHDNEYKEVNADIEIAIPIVGKVLVDSNDIEIKNLQPVKVISVIYTGPYENIGEGHIKCNNFALLNGYQLAGTTREIYLNDPNKISDPNRLMTEIQLAIK